LAHSKNSIRKTLGIMDTSSAVIKNNYIEVLYSFGKDLQSAVGTALQKYLIDLITSKIAELRKKELLFEANSQNISESEEFVINISIPVPSIRPHLFFKSYAKIAPFAQFTPDFDASS
jgi:hypothetical protein